MITRRRGLAGRVVIAARHAGVALGFERIVLQDELRPGRSRVLREDGLKASCVCLQRGHWKSLNLTIRTFAPSFGTEFDSAARPTIRSSSARCSVGERRHLRWAAGAAARLLRERGNHRDRATGEQQRDDERDGLETSVRISRDGATGKVVMGNSWLHQKR